ncbi:ATP-binding protein [Actinokineospora guangxiensis]|uniref:histidine kinase n=1 Tax=Actinokineospora guangxiensis TaxID=1490288 RepID=A0ABW0EQE8_9PSEU
MSEDSWHAEVNRLAALRALRLLDTPREERFDRITRFACDVLGTPVALVSLVDLDRQWFKSCVGLDETETPRGESVCAHAIRQNRVFEVHDLAADGRFAEFPVVTEEGLRFYAGHPISAPSGHKVGTLCVLDRRPRSFTRAERRRLADLATWVELECAVVQAMLAAQDAERAKDDFTAVVSHELRTPLTSVHGSLELLATGRFGAVSAQAERLVRIAADNAARLVRLADEVLDLSKVRAGRLGLRAEPVALAGVVQQAVHAVAGVAERAGVELAVLDCAVDVRGDSDRLVQVVTNLLGNAVSVSQPGQRVEVWCERGELLARVHVRDQGPGIPPEELERVFQPFVQLRPGGAGLGLAITRGIAEAHGGSVSAVSVPGEGAEFVVTLPAEGPGEDRAWW